MSADNICGKDIAEFHRPRNKVITETALRVKIIEAENERDEARNDAATAHLAAHERAQKIATLGGELVELREAFGILVNWMASDHEEHGWDSRTIPDRVVAVFSIFVDGKDH